MSRQGNFRRVVGSLSWTLAGEVSFAAGQFGMLVVLARLGSEAALGRYALGLAISTPLFVITSLHLRPTYIVANDERFSFGDYFGLRLVGAAAALVLSVAWSLAAGHDRATLVMVGFVALTRLSELVSDMCHAAAGRAEKLERVGISRALRGLLLLAAVGVALWWGAKPVTAVGIGALVAVVLTVVYDLPTARRYADIRPRFDRARSVELIKLAAPVGLAGGLLALTRSTPAYVLELLEGLVELGRYTAVLSVIYISGVLNMAMGSAAVPRLARLSDTDPRAFVLLLLRVVAVVALLNAAILAGCVLLGRQYLAIAYGPSFADLHTELVYAGIVVVVGGVANLLAQTLVAMRLFRLQFLFHLGSFVAAIVLSVLLIPRYGLVGGIAALGTAIGLRLIVCVVTIAAMTGRARPVES